MIAALNARHAAAKLAHHTNPSLESLKALQDAQDAVIGEALHRRNLAARTRRHAARWMVEYWRALRARRPLSIIINRRRGS